MDLVGLILCVLVVFGSYAWGPNGTLSIQIILQLFLGTAALALAGPVIVIPIFCLPFLVLRAAQESFHLNEWWRVSRATFYLALTVFIGSILAIVSPRIFQGEFLVVPLISGDESRIIPVGPVSGNITQTGYAIGNLLAFWAGRVLLLRNGGIDAYQRSMIHLSLLVSLTGFLSIFEFYTKIPSLLEVFRTAYLTHHQSFSGMPRIAGTYPETSVFSSVALGLFAFCSQLWLHQIQVQATRPATISLLLLLLLSTSGTAYAGLGLYSVFFLFSITQHIKRFRIPPLVTWLLVCALFTSCVVAVLIVFENSIVTIVLDFFDEAVFGKMSSSSGVVRGNWNYYGMKSFLNTYGLGIGFGSIRTSSLAVTVLSNLGILGTASYLLFLREVLRSPSSWQPPPMAALIDASRHGLLASLCAAVISATTFSLSVNVYLFAAMASLYNQRITSSISLKQT